ncbi:MAG: hypothetical protein CFE24_00430 [Flavobacterium sp. BFFFF2]|nr:MAG: hypothetical protein CFE24_00430 [Flavobacterium sp. BFFFF2]
MNKLTIFIGCLISGALFGQNGSPATPYYNGFNWTQTGTTLKTALSNKVINSHNNPITYSNIWEADKVTDLDPTDNTKVLLVYGWENGTDTDLTNDRSRGKTNNGAGNGQWNREHVFAKALGVPSLNENIISDGGTDAHHVRSSDVQRNNTRGNLKFATGSGNSGAVTGGWYPGDEWKGDVARMVMYMYLRYGDQCLPIYACVGTPLTTDSNMIDTLLQWNADDPVSTYEDNRNTYHGSTTINYAQGNRNPFIDNPYLATVIWGGPMAQNRWPNIFLDAPTFSQKPVWSIYPNPSVDGTLFLQSTKTIEAVAIVSVTGQVVFQLEPNHTANETIMLSDIPQGFYLVKAIIEGQATVQKLWVK